MRNYGLDLKREREVASKEDWIFGGGSKKCLVSIIEKDRFEYLPRGEIQRGIEDTMDCASRAPLNVLETKLVYLHEKGLMKIEDRMWLISKGFIDPDNGEIALSDAFNAIKSNTTKTGNSLKEPIHSIHSDGVIPKSMLPLEPWMTWNDYHNPKRITSKMEKIGKEFLKRFPVNYEKVYVNDFSRLLVEDMLIVAGHAWSKPIEGVYQEVDYKINHAFMNVKNKYFIFDNYIDSFDGDFIKHLAEDFNFLSYGYRLFFTKKSTTIKSTYWFVDIYQNIISFLKDLCSKIF